MQFCFFKKITPIGNGTDNAADSYPIGKDRVRATKIMESKLLPPPPLIQLFLIRVYEQSPFWGEKLLIRVALCGYRESLSICLCASFPFGFEGGMWDLVVPDHCPSFYFLYVRVGKKSLRN